MSLHAVILAGGSGTRFWPLSRAKSPSSSCRWSRSSRSSPRPPRASRALGPG